MIRHIVMWNHSDGFTAEEKTLNAERVKRELEALRGIVPGVLELTVCTCSLPTGNADVMLVSCFEDAGVLEKYQSHPEHKKAAEFIRSVFCDRRCFDGV